MLSVINLDIIHLVTLVILLTEALNRCYLTEAIPRYGAFYGQGSGAILLSNLQCTGSELKLLDCARDAYSVKSCQHYEDAGVKCQGSLALTNFNYLLITRIVSSTC